MHVLGGEKDWWGLIWSGLLSSALLLLHPNTGSANWPRRKCNLSIQSSTQQVPTLSIHARRSSWRRCFVGWTLGSKPLERWPQLYFWRPVPASDTRECCGGTVFSVPHIGDQRQVLEIQPGTDKVILIGRSKPLTGWRRAIVEYEVVQDSIWNSKLGQHGLNVEKKNNDHKVLMIVFVNSFDLVSERVVVLATVVTNFHSKLLRVCQPPPWLHLTGTACVWPSDLNLTTHISSFCRKQTCFLCEMPRSPWAVLHDFTELVCRWEESQQYNR